MTHELSNLQDMYFFFFCVDLICWFLTPPAGCNPNFVPSYPLSLYACTPVCTDTSVEEQQLLIIFLPHFFKNAASFQSLRRCGNILASASFTIFVFFPQSYVILIANLHYYLLLLIYLFF